MLLALASCSPTGPDHVEADAALDAALGDGTVRVDVQDATVQADLLEPRTISVDLVVDGYGTEVSRLYVPARFEQQDVLLMFDTGAAQSFINLGTDAEPWIPQAGVVEIADFPFEMAGRNFERHTAHGKQVAGTLGTDFLMLGPSDLDLRCGRLSVYLQGAQAPGASWPVLGFDNVMGHVVTPVQVDQQSLRLILDTGAQHTLLLGADGEPGDTLVETTDAVGNVLQLYLGQAELILGSDPPRTIHVLRAPSFPYLEETVKILGGNIQGLLGLSSLTGRSILVDGSSSELRLEPFEGRTCN